jgi:Carboxypeptidase regulatory-like domain
MKTAKRIFLATALVALVATLGSFAAGTLAQGTAPVGHSTIHGRAIYEDTERPVRRAAVLLFADEDPGQSRTVVTDGRGEFIFKNIPAGHYHVVVDFPGYLNGFPQIDLKKRKATDVSVDGNSSAEITVRTERGGAITGKVTYPDGEPAVGAQVNVLIKNGKQWSHAPFVSAGAQTDDRGIYRIYPLQPGEYVVSVIEQSLLIEEREGGTMQTVGNKSLNPYYYSDAASIKTATIIQVDAGREVNNINLTLADRPTYHVAGTISASGKPLAGAYLRLGPHDEGLSGPTQMRPYGLAARADQDGRWSFNDIPDGTYDVELDPTADDLVTRSSQNGPVRTQRRFVGRRQQVTVAGADVLDVAMSLSEGGRISGTIVVEGDKPLPHSTEVRSKLLATAGSQDDTAGVNVDGASKGSFLIEGVPTGENYLIVRVFDRNYFVKSMMWNGRDLLRQTLKVQEGNEVKDVRIILSRDVGTLTGHIVLGQNKQPLVRGFFRLIPADEVRWNRSDAFVFGQTDNQGAFNVTGAPGEYILITLAPGDNRDMSIDEFRSRAAEAPHVMLKVGELSSAEVVVPLR